jgi:protein SCO1/2
MNAPQDLVHNIPGAASMQKALSIVLTIVAASVVVALLTYKFLSNRMHVQVEVPATDNQTATDPAGAGTPMETALTFQLTDEAGQPFTGDSLKGKISVVNFVFKNCKTVCPFIMSKTRGLAPDLQDFYDQVRFVSITVDPANDTREVLAAWQKEVAVSGLEWKFVTGEKPALLAAVKDQFKQTVMDNAADMNMPIAHSSYLVLVDADGKIAGFYDSNESFRIKELTEKAASLAADLKKSRAHTTL